ncbi:helix-turn-helix domain-containing protein [Streptomyces chrestomyceticus]|uniref:helix-turn-helix domain-containing protein n=1 Tax=Streptomyces chrestomyceticus TaxID=68185 RepID=UPI0033CB0957
MSPEISSNLRKHRRRLGWSQERLAEAAGVSPGTVRKLEQGGVARVETLAQLAEALNVDTAALFAPPASPEPIRDDGPSRQQLLDLRRHLMPPVGLVDAIGPPEEDVPRSALLRDIDEAHALYQADRYDSVARRLPGILSVAGGSVRAADEAGQRRQALVTRARALFLTGKYLTQVRQYDLAYQALASGIRDAREAEATPAAAVGVIGMCWLLLRQDRFAECADLASDTADAVEPRISKATPEELAVWGELLLRVAAAAVRNNRKAEAKDARRMAATAAQAIGREHIDFRTHWGPFGPATAEIKAIEDLSLKGDARGVLRRADTGPLHPDSLKAYGTPTSNVWGRYRLDVAQAHSRSGAHHDATEILMGIYRSHPEWMRHQPMARRAVEKVLRTRTRTLTVDMRTLASHLGVNG